MRLLNVISIGYLLFNLFQRGKEYVLSNIDYNFQKFALFRDVKLFDETVIIRVSIKNINSFDIPVSEIEGRLGHNGIHIGVFRSTNQKMLPSGKMVLWEIPIKYTSENALNALEAMMEGTGAAKIPFDIQMTLRGTVQGKTLSYTFENQIPLF